MGRDGGWRGVGGRWFVTDSWLGCGHRAWTLLAVFSGWQKKPQMKTINNKPVSVEL